MNNDSRTVQSFIVEEPKIEEEKSQILVDINEESKQAIMSDYVSQDFNNDLSKT